MADNVLRSQIVVDASQFTTAMHETAGIAEDTTGRIAAGFDRVGLASEASAEKMNYSFMEARHAAMGFGEEVGIHLPRFVSTFLAHTQMIGPALALAFTPVAIVGVGMVLVDVGKKMVDFYQNTVNLKDAFEELDKEAEKLSHVEITLSNEITRQNAELLNLKEGGIVGAKAEIGALGSQIVDLRNEFDTTSEAFKAHPEVFKEAFTQYETFPAKDIAKQIQAVTAEINRLNAASAQAGPAASPLMEWAMKVAGAEAKTTTEDVETLRAKTQAYQQVLELLTLEQQKLGGDISVTTQRLAEQILEMSKSQAAAAKAALNKQFNQPPDLSGAGNALAAVDQFQSSDEAALQTLQTTAAQTWAKFESDAKAAYEETQKASEQNTEATIREAEKALAIRNQELDAEYHAHVITNAQMVADKKQALEQEYLAEKAALDQRINTIGPLEVDARRKVDDQLTALHEQYLEKLAALDQQSANNFERVYQSMTSQLNRNFMQWINGAETFGRAMEKTWNSLASAFIESMLKTAEQMIVNAALQKSILASTKIADAEAAASHTYASVSAIPYVGWIMAPPAAAAAFAAVMAFEDGGIVPRTQMALVHGGESVLPKNLTTMLTSVADKGGGAGGDQFHFHATIHAVDSRGVKEMLDDHAALFGRAAMDYMRRRG
jgi:hypothetical protein